MTARQHERARHRRQQLVDDRAADLARPAEQHDRLWFLECVLHRQRAFVWCQPEPPAQVAGPHAGRIDALTDREPIVEAWVAAAHRGRGGLEVLGEVQAPAGVEHESVEAGEQLRQAGAAGGHVDRQRPPLDREAERSRVARSETLQHREEDRQRGRRDALDHGAQRRLGTERHDELVLHEPAAAVDAVPLADQVERMEVGRDRLQLAFAYARRLAVPHLVEGGDRQSIDDARPRDDRRQRHQLLAGVRQRSAGVLGVELGRAGVVGVGQHAPSEVAAGRKQVEPGHRVAEVGVVLRHARHDLVEVVDPPRVDRHQAGVDRDQPERRIEDHTGQPHPADGRPEQLRVAVRTDLDDGRVGQHQPQPGDLIAERPVEVVVLAVDVAGDRPTDRDEARARGDGHEPTARHDDVEQVVEADPGRHGHGAGGVVDLHCVVGRAQPQHVSTAVLRGVAVRAPETAGDAAPIGQVLDRRREAGLVDVDHVRRARCRPSPSREQRPSRSV